MQTARIRPSVGVALAALLLAAPSARSENMPPEQAREVAEEGLKALKKLFRDDPKDRFLLQAAVGATGGERMVVVAPTKQLPGEDGKSLSNKGGIVGVIVCLGDLVTPGKLPLLDAGSYLLVARLTSERKWVLSCVAATGRGATVLPSELDSVRGDIDRPLARLEWKGKKLSLELQFPTFDPDKDDLALKCELQVEK